MTSIRPVSIAVAASAAEWASSLSWPAVPAEVREAMLRGVIHSIAGGVAGFDVPETRLVREIARAEGGSGPCSILVSGESVAIGDAIFVNSVMFCALEQQEMHAESATHPFETIVPVALAIAEVRAVTGREFLEAILAGFEIMTAFAQAAQHYLPQTAAGSCLGASVHGALGAAVTAARLLGLGADGIALSLAHAANLAAGLNESNLVGSTEYHYALANASRVGYLAARLAEAGAEASPTSFDGPAGYFHRFAEIAAGDLNTVELTELATGHLGSHWSVPETLYKRYPVHFYNLPYVDGAKLLREKHGIAPESIRAIHIVINHWCEWCNGGDLGPYYRRESTRGATAFGIAAMLARGEFDLAAADDPAASDIARLVERTTVEVFADEAKADDWRSVRIEVQTDDGSFVYDSMIDGMPDYRLGLDEILGIAARVLGDTIPADRVDPTLDLLARLDGVADVRELLLLLTDAQTERAR